MIRIGMFGRVTVEPEFWQMPAACRLAVIAHEAGHRFHKHLRARWLANWLLCPVALRTLYHAQEFQADAFAKSLGYGAPLAAALALQPEQPTLTHPGTAERILRLRRDA